MFSALASYYRQKITKAEKHLKVLASVDALTGLNNRSHFEADAEQHIARFQRSGISSAVVIADVDFFKKINDTYGHEAGDLVLVAVSRLLKKELREVDSLARWGGEEFVFLMHETGLPQAIAVTERIRDAVEASSVSYHATEIRCTMSFGITALLPHDTLGDAIARADRALYRSKSQGRNRVSAD
jgi:diguanylate cyclase (GGDEF)-like protein